MKGYKAAGILQTIMQGVFTWLFIGLCWLWSIYWYIPILALGFILNVVLQVWNRLEYDREIVTLQRTKKASKKLIAMLLTDLLHTPNWFAYTFFWLILKFK